VQGIVTSTSGQANNGTVQVKVVSSGGGRFRYAQRGVNRKKAQLRNFLVNNGTRYQIVSSQGRHRNGSFKSLQPGEPVLILAGNRNGASNLAQVIDMFPKNRKAVAVAAMP